MAIIPEAFRDLLEKKAFAHLATLMPDGSPQVTPVWFDVEGDFIRVNSAVGRQKDRNIRRDPRVALSVTDPDNPERHLRLRGVVSEITEEGGDEHIDALSRKYTGHGWQKVSNQRRVVYKIRLTHVSGGE